MIGTVNLTQSKGIGTINFFHPKGNSLPKALLHKLAVLIAKAGDDPKISVLILKSSGEGAFCAGASFDELMKTKDMESGKDFFLGFAKVILAMKNCPKFILCRVHGKAVGGGVGIIAASDYALASNNASVKLSELTLGIGPFVIAPVVERKIGLSAFSTLSINASKWQKAAWASEKGLFNSVFESTEDLDNAVSELAEILSKSSPKAMKELKKILWKESEALDTLLSERAELSGKLVLSGYTKSFIKSFKSK